MSQLIPGTSFPTWRGILQRTDPRSLLPPVQYNVPLDNSEYILNLLKESQPSPRVMGWRRQLLERIERSVQSRYGSRYVVSIFGSSSYGLDSDGTDLDITIVDTMNLQGGKPPNQAKDATPYSLNHLAQCLRGAGFRIDRVVQNANTPIIVLSDPLIPIPMDINVNCLSGNYNSLFLSTHLSLSPSVFLPLAIFLKTWARARSLSSSSFSPANNLTSYALTLLLLSYLVNIGAVQKLLHPTTGEEEGEEEEQWVDEETRVQTRKGETNVWVNQFPLGKTGGEVQEFELGDMAYGFFIEMAQWEERVHEDMMSLRLGGQVGRTESEWLGGRDACLVVEDPFVLDRNTTGSLSRASGKRFFEEARRARDILGRGGSIAEVLSS